MISLSSVQSQPPSLAGVTRICHGLMLSLLAMMLRARTWFLDSFSNIACPSYGWNSTMWKPGYWRLQ